MKLVIIAALALVAAASAAPQGVDQKVVQILRSEYNQQPDGQYVFGFDTDDKTSRDETGELKTVTDEENKPQTVITMRGSYSYLDSEGNPHNVNYYADETGFHAESADIPTAPVARR